MLLLSLVSFAIALVSDSAWGLLASTVRAWFACSPRRLQLVSLGGGLAMIALACWSRSPDSETNFVMGKGQPR